MKVASKYAISFYSDSLNKSKYDLLMNKAKEIRDFKNSLSEKICACPLLIKDLTQYDFLKKFNCGEDGLVGREIQPALTDVYTKYQNKIDQFNQRIEFKLQKEFVLEYYKKNTTKKKKGDFKQYTMTYRATRLTRVLTFLAKYYNETTVQYMIGEIENKETKKAPYQIALYKDVLEYIDKYGDRLFEIVEMKRESTIREIFKTPILFKEFTYSAVNNTELLAESKNKGKSKISHYITLTGFVGITDSGKLVIPVKYDKNHHGDISLFNKKQTSYTIQFVKDKIRIILTKDGIRDYKEDGSKILGVDVNLKHNLFSMSNGKTIDFDREMIKNYVKTMLKFDKKQELLYKKEESELTPQETKQKAKILARIASWSRRLNGHYIDKTHELVKEAKDEWYDHLAMEDLLLSDKSFFVSEEFCGIKYSRLVKILHLSNFKNIVSNQCYNNNMQLSIIPSPFTSQRCHKCGYTDRENRKTQEEFECINCGYTANADYNASQNTKIITESDVLRDKLLKKDSNGWLVPKTNNKETIKKTLDNYCQQKIVTEPLNGLV